MVRMFEDVLNWDNIDMGDRIEMAYIVHSVYAMRQNIKIRNMKTYLTFNINNVSTCSVFMTGPYKNKEILFTVPSVVTVNGCRLLA